MDHAIHGQAIRFLVIPGKSYLAEPGFLEEDDRDMLNQRVEHGMTNIVCFVAVHREAQEIAQVCHVQTGQTRICHVRHRRRRYMSSVGTGIFESSAQKIVSRIIRWERCTGGEECREPK